MGVLALLVSAAAWQPILAAPIATEAAIVNNFLLNDHWTFRDKREGRRLWERFVRYNMLTLGGVLISMATFALLVYFARMHYLVGDLLAIAAGTVWNYSANSLVTWVEPSVY